MKPRVILVCGGRDYDDADAVNFLLDGEHARHPIALVFTGAATGADWWAESWARAREISYRGVPAQWKKYGRSAGPRRNEVLRTALLHYQAQGYTVACVAFPGGRGTAHMVGLCRAAGVAIIEKKEERHAQDVSVPGLDDDPGMRADDPAGP